MVPETLTELVTLSNELAQLKGKPPASSRPVPEDVDLHPELAQILASGAMGLKLQGVDAGRVAEFTERARKRGMRRKLVVFGWHPKGHTWFAAPERAGKDAGIVAINRLDRLSITELPVSDFVDLCVAGTREAIEVAAAAAEPEPAADGSPKVSHQPKLKGSRKVKVVLPENDGATITAGDTVEEFSSADFGYVVWTMTALALVSEGKAAPDLGRWERRCLRSCRLDAVPAVGDADRARYDENWDRLTLRDRSAPGPVSYQVPSYKLAAQGRWVLGNDELLVLRRAEKSIAPRHTPSAKQAKIWARFMKLVTADDVEIRVH